MRHILIGLAALAAAIPAHAAAQQAQPPAAASPVSPQLTQRAQDVVAVLRGEADLPQIFAPGFLAQVPPAQIAAVGQQLSAQFGAVQELAGVTAQSENAGTIRIAFEQGVVIMSLQLEAAAPHRIAGLLVTGNEPRGGDSAETILGELRTLPGQVSFAIARLGNGAPTMIASHEPERPLAIGSTFKLIILAELSRQIQAGERRWNDVVALERHSLPSGILQDWPLGSPVTVHTLAGLMISRSDNTATDALLRLVGRENVERMMERMGMANAARNRPFLTTMEAFQLKADEPEVRARWAQANEAERRRLLRERYEEGGASVDLSRIYTSGPTAIDTVEWFASSTDLIKVMDWLRRHGDETPHGVMAISPGVSRDAAGELSYVGFKGGSEPGVINLTYLVRNNEGAWHVVTGSWNNPAAALEDARFIGLLGRAVRLVR